MNAKYLFAVFMAALACLSGCEKKLDGSPISNPSTSTFYSSAEGAAAAITAVYAQLRGDLYGIESILTPTTVAADDGVPFLTGNADRRALWSYTVSTSNNWTSSPWTWGYIAIQRANVAISRIPGINMDENLKKRYVAEAKFIRAMMYFNLVRFYGGVSLITTETLTTNREVLDVPRSSADEVYALIEADLKEAETVLPTRYTGSDIGRATKGAAKGLLAKVYLTRAGNSSASSFWLQAAASAKEVTDLGVYDLWNNFADVFDMKNRGGKNRSLKSCFFQMLRAIFIHRIGRREATPGFPSMGLEPSGPLKVCMTCLP